MRLGQLSRKLSVRATEIVAFLATKGAVIEDSVNTRIDDEHTRAVIAHFAPEMKFDEAIPDEIMEDKSETATTQLQELMPAEVQPVSMAETLDAKEAEVNLVQHEGEVQDGTGVVTEVIKAAKVELQGLKVVGKIELPEPKKKESPRPEENTDGEDNNERSDRRGRPESNKIQTQNKNTTSRPRKNPVVLKRERETREAEERRKADLEREKEKRTQFYLRRIKTAPPSRKINLVDEPLNELKDEAPDEPRTLWGKFVKWLTSH